MLTLNDNIMVILLLQHATNWNCISYYRLFDFVRGLNNISDEKISQYKSLQVYTYVSKQPKIIINSVGVNIVLKILEFFMLIMGSIVCYFLCVMPLLTFEISNYFIALGNVHLHCSYGKLVVKMRINLVMLGVEKKTKKIDNYIISCRCLIIVRNIETSSVGLWNIFLCIFMEI